MNLLQESINFIIWLFKVISAFIRVQPLTTVAVIAMSVASRITNLLAFFMPLKVLLLAGSPGVPRYFQFFVAPDQKMEWIYILGGGAIVSYFLTLLLESLTERLSSAGSEQVLQESEAIPLFQNQRSLAQNYYANFSQISAALIFVGACFLVGFFINLPFFAFLTAMLLFFFLISCFLVRPPEKSLPGSISYYILENHGSYIKILSSVFFLAAFVVLLLPFLLSDYTNILVALLSFIIMRRSLSALNSVIKNGVKLSRQKHRINALVFPDIQLQEKKQTEEKIFFEFFHKPARQEHTLQTLQKIITLPDKMQVLWEDSTIPGVSTLAIVPANYPAEPAPCFRQHIFSQKQSQKLEKEEFLFTYIPRSRLKAPEPITLYFMGQFQCQVLDYGTSQIPSIDKWLDIEDTLLAHLWSYAPPQELTRTCAASWPLMHDRLSQDLLSKVEIAVDTEHEMQHLQHFIDQLPAISSRLEKLPLFIYNPDLKQHNVALGPGNELYIMFWGRWALEPVGVDMPSRLRKNGLSQIVAQIRQHRKDIPFDFSETDIFLAADCWELETLIKKKRFKAALQLMSSILYPDAETDQTYNKNI